MPFFEGFKGEVFFRPFPNANLKGPESGATVTPKMEFFDTKLPGVWVF